jgi:hypothetical protein
MATTRVDSYGTPNSGSAASQLSKQGIQSKVHLVAASTQYDLTGSNAGNHAFRITGTPNAATILTFADGSSIQAAQLGASANVLETTFEYELSKIVTHADNTVVVLWK